MITSKVESPLNRYCNVPHRTIFCHDNLEILQGINSECIDLIYLDPPFNKKKTFTAPIGSSAEGASFKDIFTEEDVKDEWVQTIKEDYFAIYRLLEAVKDIEGRSSYNFCYLAYMAIRLMECRRVVKNTGSIYLHCDKTMSHYLKLLMDCIFMESNFISHVVWDYKKISNSKGKLYNARHQDIFFYSKTKNYAWNQQYTEISPRKQQLIEAGFNTKNMNGETYIYIYDIKKVKAKNKDLSKYDHVCYPDTEIGTRQSDIFNVDQISSPNERTGYPTQKPLALLERIIKASSNEGDIVLDPFCGCATTCVAAEKLGRRWVGIDISIKAYELVQSRIKKEVYESGGLLNGKNGYMPEIEFSASPPQRTDKDSGSKDRKYVYIVSHPKYRGEYKVGIASDVKSRLTAYQTSDPNRQYKLEYTVETEYYRELETHIHDMFENKHEWVRAELTDIKAEMGGYKPKTKGELFDEAEHN